jgi:hypothetical protein
MGVDRDGRILSVRVVSHKETPGLGDKAMAVDYARIARNGLWDNNVVLVQMVALCPTMAVTSSATNGLGMGLATTAVLATSNLMISSLRHASARRCGYRCSCCSSRAWSPSWTWR